MMYLLQYTPEKWLNGGIIASGPAELAVLLNKQHDVACVAPAEAGIQAALGAAGFKLSSSSNPGSRAGSRAGSIAGSRAASRAGSIKSQQSAASLDGASSAASSRAGKPQQAAGRAGSNNTGRIPAVKNMALGP